MYNIHWPVNNNKNIKFCTTGYLLMEADFTQFFSSVYVQSHSSFHFAEFIPYMKGFLCVMTQLIYIHT